MTFDASAFMGQTVDEPISSQRVLCPEGEYLFKIDDFNFDEKTFRPIKRKDGTETTILRLPFVCLDENVQKELGRDKVVVYYKDLWLDMVPGTTQLDTSKGKNVDLGALRKALGLTTGDIFGPLRGAGPLLCRVAHRSYDDSDPEKKVAEITRATSAKK